ncbi:MAG: 50S ribosomal protein L22 [Candidatus Levybacteria bacterium]|nr:50S ribosomal protein L22 [Candidatus Levybacteria bacterium]
MENKSAVAKSSAVRVSTRKVRLVADSIRGLTVEKALAALSQLSKRGASSLEKTLKSAVANAVGKGMVKEKLFIKNLEVGQAPSLKRYHPSTRGRVHPYQRKGSHIKIVLEERSSQIANRESKSEERKAIS